MHYICFCFNIQPKILYTVDVLYFVGTFFYIVTHMWNNVGYCFPLLYIYLWWGLTALKFSSTWVWHNGLPQDHPPPPYEKKKYLSYFGFKLILHVPHDTSVTDCFCLALYHYTTIIMAKDINKLTAVILFQEGYTYLFWTTLSISITSDIFVSSLLMKEVPRKVFEGPPGHQTFSKKPSALNRKLFVLCGRIVSWSIMHGGPGLPLGLSPIISHLMLDDEYQFDVVEALQCILDQNAKRNISKVLNTILKAVTNIPCHLLTWLTNLESGDR